MLNNKDEQIGEQDSKVEQANSTAVDQQETALINGNSQDVSLQAQNQAQDQLQKAEKIVVREALIDSKPRAIPLVSWNPKSEKFEINPEARRVVEQIPGPIGVLAVAGAYRTGKSYLLNRVLLNA